MTTTQDAWLAELPEERRTAFETIRETVRAHADPALEEGMQYGAPGWYVPHSVCPDGYHCDAKQPVPYLGFGARKKFMTLNFFGLYIEPEVKERFIARWTEDGRKLDMGAACIRFKSLDDVSLDALAEALDALSVARFMELYEASVPAKAKKKRSGVLNLPKAKAKKPAAAKKKPAAKKTKPAAAKKKAAK